jgi:hypothetical protein
MGHKQDGAGKFIPRVKHTKNAYGGKISRHLVNRALRRRIKEAIKISPNEPILGLRHF